MVLSDKGFLRPTYAELLEEQIARAKKLFGEDIETAETTALGKFMRLNTYDISGLYEMLESVYYARFPNTATGISLDRLCLFVGLSRNPATEAIHIIKLYGEANKEIEAEFKVGTIDNITFSLINNVTLASTVLSEDVIIDGNTIAQKGSTIGIGTGLFACDDVGTVGNVAVGDIYSIVNPNTYVMAIEHIGISELGTEIENDVSLRKRFTQAVSAVGSGTIDSIYSAILRVSGVTGCYIIENDTGSTVDNRPPKSFECYVLGGDDEDIAEAIFSKAPIGISTVTTTEAANQRSISIEDSGGTKHIINFSRTVEKDIYIKVTIAVNTHFEDTGITDIKDNIIQHLATLTNGEDVIYSSLFSDVHSVTGVVSSTIQLSADGTDYTSSDVIIKGSEVARSSTDIIEVIKQDYVDY